MDPTTPFSFPSPVDYERMYFPVGVYRAADGAGSTRCRFCIDSPQGCEQRSSVMSTNRIIELLNESVRKPLREIPGFPRVAENPDTATVQKVEQILQRFITHSPPTPVTGPAREQRIDVWKRIYNIFRASYEQEIIAMAKILVKSRGCSLKDAMGIICTKGTGSLADCIGVELIRQIEEQIRDLNRQIAVEAVKKGISVQQLMEHMKGFMGDAENPLYKV